MPSKRIVTFPTKGPPSAALLCCPFAGADIAVFARWRLQLDAPVQLASVQLPARGARHTERQKATMAELVEELGPEALAFEPQLPLVLFGHSFGAFLGFELASWLEARGRPLRRLVVSGQTGPWVPRTLSPIADLPEPAFIDAVQARYGNSIPEQLLADPELLRLTMGPLRADLKLLEGYLAEPRPPLSCDVLACGGADDPVVDLESLRAWREVTRATFETQTFPGGHFYFQANPAPLLRRLEQLLRA